MAAPKKTTESGNKAPTKAPTKNTTKAPAKKNAADELAKVDGENGVQTETKASTAPPKKGLTAAAKKKILAVPAIPTDAISDTCQAVESLKADEAISIGKELLESQEYSEFKLGGILSVIDINGYWQQTGAESFKSFIQEHYNIQYRKANYLMKIYNSLVVSGVDWEQVSHIGWSKLKEICDKLTTENVDVWVKLAESNTVVNLIEEIKKRDGDGELKEPKPDKNDADTPNVSTRTFRLHEDQKATVNDAVEMVKEQLDTEHDSTAITHMCEMTLQGKLGKKAGNASAAKGKEKPWDEQIRERAASEDDEQRVQVVYDVIELMSELYPEYDFSVDQASDGEEEEEEQAEE
ncbi:hypothetical protein [Vibrio phage vB_VhaS-a]|nr:hypothetical protein [Vibrio phage vB_VhaS-a]